MKDIDFCPCCSNIKYESCCGRFINQGINPRNAESLMRSRYSAYVLRDIAYLTKTWHQDTRPELNLSELNSTQWLRLEVLQSKTGLKKSTVEFKAYFQSENGEQFLHEHSEFKKVKNHWVYFKAIDT